MSLKSNDSTFALDYARANHWQDLAGEANQIHRYLTLQAHPEEPPGDESGGMPTTIRLSVSLYSDAFLAENLLLHLMAEFPEIPWPSCWDELHGTDVPPELLEVLQLVAARRTFKGTCDICREWDCPEAVGTQEPLTVGKAIEEFAADLRFRGRTKKTIEKNYLSFLRRSLRGYGLVPTDPKIIRQLLAAYKRNTAHTYRLYFSAFYSFLGTEHGIPNPMTKVPSPGTDKTLPSHLNPEQKRQLQEVNLSPRDRAIVKLFLETAIRPDEVIGTRGHPLRFCDIYEETLEVSGKTGERMVPASPGLRDMLLSLRNGRPADSVVFVDGRGHPLTTWGLRKVIKRAFRAAGISGVKATPYTLRHSFAGEFLANGGDLATLQKILGHKDIETTMIYTHIADKAMVDVYRRNASRATNPL